MSWKITFHHIVLVLFLVPCQFLSNVENWTLFKIVGVWIKFCRKWYDKSLDPHRESVRCCEGVQGVDCDVGVSDSVLQMIVLLRPVMSATLLMVRPAFSRASRRRLPISMRAPILSISIRVTTSLPWPAVEDCVSISFNWVQMTPHSSYSRLQTAYIWAQAEIPVHRFLRKC